MKAKALSSISVLLLLSIGLVSGCGKKDDTPKSFERTGVVKGVDAKSGVVTFAYYNKDGILKIGKGKLAPDAEILIDGVTAAMEDVNVGEEVTVRGYIDHGVGGEPRIVATTVIVKRGDTIEIDQTTKPGS